MTRRAVLATLAAAALTACSSTTVVTAAKDSGVDTTDDAGTDDAGTATCTPSGTSAGALASFTQGTWKAVGAFIVGHDAGGLFAFSTRCTHQGCTIGAPSSSGATTCPCHGARFDGNGAVVQGPARTPLPHFALTVCDGKVYVDETSEVASATRTAAA
jgi:Rieske Fe-S protein